MDNNNNNQDDFKPPSMNGPETAPLPKFVKRYLIDIVIYDKNDNIVKETTIDYGDFEQKRWLGKLSFWAWNEGHTVETSQHK